MSCCLRMKWQKSQLSSKAPKIALDIRANALSYFPPLTSNIAAQATPPTWRSKAMCCMLTSLERQPLPPPRSLLYKNTVTLQEPCAALWLKISRIMMTPWCHPSQLERVFYHEWWKKAHVSESREISQTCWVCSKNSRAVKDSGTFKCFSPADVWHADARLYAHPQWWNAADIAPRSSLQRGVRRVYNNCVSCFQESTCGHSVGLFMRRMGNWGRDERENMRHET